MKRNYTKIVLDLMMAITFVLLMNPRVFNGLPFHEIAGLIIGIAVLIHIGLNYRWVINTTKKIFNPKIPAKARFGFLLNILLLISMAAVIITGILISRVVFPNLAIQGGHSIRGLHSLSADATLALVGLHIGLHWKWIMSICKKAFITKEGKLKKGMIASTVLAMAILAGGIQWFSSTASANIGDFKQIQQVEPSFNNGNASNTFTNEAPPSRDFHGRDGHGGHSSPFLSVLKYFVIWMVIILPTYYLEKTILRNKRRSSNVRP